MSATPSNTTPPRRGKKEMGALLLQSGIELTESQLDRLWRYHELLRRHNPDLNLTRIHNFENMVLKLYADSMLPGLLLKDIPSPVMDLGSGPGMPGIPLKIFRPQLEMILAESRGKRADFLNMVVRELRLENVQVVAKGISELYEKPVHAVITRAVETIVPTLERIRGCLAENGQAIFMKGPGCDAEIAEAQSLCGAEFRLASDTPYSIPHTPHERRLVVFERIGKPVWQRKAAALRRHPCRAIESESNSLFKQWKTLRSGKGIRKSGVALVSGPKIVAETLRAFPERCLGWIAPDNRPPGPDVPESAVWYRLAPPLFRELDDAGAHSPLLLVSVPEMPSWRPEDGFETGCTLLVPFQDPENVGTAIRSAVAFGVARIVLLAESAHPFHPKSVRASGGAVFQANLLRGPALADVPERADIVALSADGPDIGTRPFPAAFGLLAGLEGPGLPDRFRPRAVSIPMLPSVESLNAATATAIAMYAWFRCEMTKGTANDSASAKRNGTP